MNPPPKTDHILKQIRTCLDAAMEKPGLVKASVHQTEGYLRGLQGLAWETPASPPPSPDDAAALFLNAVRSGQIPLRGRVRKQAQSRADAFFEGLCMGFPEAKSKPFARALSKLWTRWKDQGQENAFQAGKTCGVILQSEYEQGEAGELSTFLLDERLHLRPTRDYLRMRGWLQGIIEYLQNKPDWKSRAQAQILKANFTSVVLRSLHNASPSYAAAVVDRLPSMMAQLDGAIETLAAEDSEASFYLRKNRQTILTYALHSGYLNYPIEAALTLPKTLRGLNQRIGELDLSSPEEARTLRNNLPSLIYRALTNGQIDAP